MGDGIEDAKTGVSAIARNQHHLNATRLGFRFVQRQQFLYEGKRHTGVQQFFFVLHLILAIRIDSLFHINLMAALKIKERA